MPIRAVIFDFDGVLADTEELHCGAFQQVVGEIGLSLSRADYFETLLGLPDRDCLATLCQRAGRSVSIAELDELVVRKRARFAALSRDARLYPGVVAMLRQLHPRFTLAVASGAFRDEIEPVLERDHVRELFAAVIGAEDVRVGKPAPDPFVAALRALNADVRSALTAADCVVIEDSPNGITAARAAGMRCIAVTTSHSRAAVAAADAVFVHASQLRHEDLSVL